MQLGWSRRDLRFGMISKQQQKKNPTYTQQKEVLWSKNKHIFISAASEIQNKGNAFPYLSRGSEVRAQVQMSSIRTVTARWSFWHLHFHVTQ